MLSPETSSLSSKSSVTGTRYGRTIESRFKLTILVPILDAPHSMSDNRPEDWVTLSLSISLREGTRAQIWNLLMIVTKTATRPTRTTRPGGSHARRRARDAAGTAGYEGVHALSRFTVVFPPRHEISGSAKSKKRGQAKATQRNGWCNGALRQCSEGVGSRHFTRSRDDQDFQIVQAHETSENYAFV
jgi:hypothetical protein